MVDIRSVHQNYQTPLFRSSGTYESPLAFRLMHKHRILSKSSRSIRAKSEAPYESRSYYRPKTHRNEMDDVYSKLITSPTNKPVFTQRLRPRVIQESNNVKLTCTVDGKPTPTVTWFKGRTQITGSSNRYITKYQHGMCILEISKCVANDSGDYICKASNSVGSDETSATIFVEVSRKIRHDALADDTSLDQGSSEISERKFSDAGPRQRQKREIVFEPQIVQQLQELTVFTGSVAMLQCKIEGKPFPEILWFKDGQQLFNDEEKVNISNTNQEARLLIKAVKMDDSGEYECRITNKAGEASTKTIINVKQGAVSDETDESLLQPSEGGEKVKSENMGDASEVQCLPYFIKQLKSMNVNEAEEMLLTCEIESSSANAGDDDVCVVEWLRNNKSIPENPDFIRQSENGSHSLRVHEMFPEDSGTFGLSATNSIGTRTSVCTVLVHEEGSKKEFDILDFPTSTNVQLGQSIHLECVVGGTDPIEGVWYVNDVQITSDMKGFRTEKTEKGTGAQVLAIYIDEANEAIHEGYYKLELSKSEGQKKLTLCASVHVQ